MTNENKQKLAERIAEKAMSAKNVTYAVVLQAVHEALNARDEEVERLEDKFAKAQNPWREGLPTEDGEYLVECGYYKCGELHAFHKTLYWKHDEWINECLGDFVLRWMPIPKGGEV